MGTDDVGTEEGDAVVDGEGVTTMESLGVGVGAAVTFGVNEGDGEGVRMGVCVGVADMAGYGVGLCEMDELGVGKEDRYSTATEV
ncbi:MAG: hypothetical protein NWF05_02720 [Candidatus Bathyarchaeota archaeon]|nr:hypothetical protein [Candidatus Bathyarchaeota archaeon]